MTDIFSQTVQPPLSLIAPKRTFGEFTAYITLSEKHEDTLELTNHPVQQGAEITDHAYKNPAKLAIEIQFDNRTDSLVNIYNKLLLLQNNRALVNITTGKRAYSNMLIKSVATTTDNKTEKVLRVSVELQEIIITNTATVTLTRVRAGVRGLAGASAAGVKSPVSVKPSEKERSALGILFNG